MNFRRHDLRLKATGANFVAPVTFNSTRSAGRCAGGALPRVSE
jgi:hypothetical protein